MGMTRYWGIQFYLPYTKSKNKMIVDTTCTVLLPEIVTFKKYNCLLLPGNGWAQGSFIEAEAEAEARQGSNVLNRGEARQIRQRARGRGEAD